MKTNKKPTIFDENVKNLAEIYEAPVIYFPPLEMYQVNLTYDEFHKKCSLPHVKQKMTQFGFIINGMLSIQIAGSGYWDYQNWFDIYRQKLSYALPSTSLTQ